MAKGDKPRQHAVSLNNANSLLGFENSLDNLIFQIASNRLSTDLSNQQLFDNYNYQNMLANFQMEDQLRAYNHSKNIYGLNQQAIDMEVGFQQQQIYDNADARLQELAYAQQDLDFSFARDSIENNFNQANNSLLLKINQEQTNQRNRQFGTDMKSASIEQNQAKADARRSLLTSSLKTQAETGAAQASGRRGQSAQMQQQSIESVAAIDHYALYSQLERGESAFNNTATGMVNQKASEDFIASKEQDKILNDKDQLAQLFGLTVQQYEADTEKLGRMMIDTYAGIETQLDRLAQQEFESRVELYAKMPLPPRMPERAKPPNKIPYDKYAFPTQPFFMDHKTMAAAQSAPKRSGLSTALGIGSMILGAAGTVLTARAAAPAIFGANAAVWGAGLSGTSSILGGLGQSGLFN